MKTPTSIMIQFIDAAIARDKEVAPDDRVHVSNLLLAVESTAERAKLRNDQATHDRCREARQAFIERGIRPPYVGLFMTSRYV